MAAVLVVASGMASAEPAGVPAIPVSATITGGAAAAASSATVATESVMAPPASSTVSAAPEKWTAAELEILRCRHARHVRGRDQGATISSWLNPVHCAHLDMNGEAAAAWDRYLKYSRRYDECVVLRRTRSRRTFLTGFAAGGLLTGAVFGIGRRSGSTALVAAVSVGAITGIGYWLLDRRRPDPPCGREPVTEWPQ